MKLKIMASSCLAAQEAIATIAVVSVFYAIASRLNIDDALSTDDLPVPRSSKKYKPNATRIKWP